MTLFLIVSVILFSLALYLNVMGLAYHLWSKDESGVPWFSIIVTSVYLFMVTWGIYLIVN